jgi:hypothetical protein
VDIFIGYVFAEIVEHRKTGEVPKIGVDKTPRVER